MNIVCLAGCDWTATWQPTQEIMTRLAKLGHRILYIDPTGTRNLHWSDRTRLWHRLKAKWFHDYPVTWYRGYDNDVVTIQHHERITLYHPLVMPFPTAPVAVSMNCAMLLRRISRWLDGAACDVLWFWFPSPLNVALRTVMRPRRAVYQIMSSISGVRGNLMHESEEQLIHSSDVVFVNSDTLRRQVSGKHPKVYLFRAGCDLTLFDPDASYSWNGKPALARPDDLPTGKPIIGYIGGRHQWFDEALWSELQRRLPQYHFVAVTGMPHYALPPYLHHFDVCLVPYRADAYTATSFPAKLMEYLAMGKPVVATRTPELEAFADEFAVWLGLSSTIEEFEKNIHKAISGHTGLRGHNLRHIAMQHDYAQIVPKMLELLAC